MTYKINKIELELKTLENLKKQVHFDWQKSHQKELAKILIKSRIKQLVELSYTGIMDDCLAKQNIGLHTKPSIKHAENEAWPGKYQICAQIWKPTIIYLIFVVSWIFRVSNQRRSPRRCLEPFIEFFYCQLVPILNLKTNV